MNRLDFLKEVAGSMIQTVKYVYEPFLSDDLKKIEEAADKALGITWVPIMKVGEMAGESEIHFISGKPVILYSQEGKVLAISGICPVCSNLIQVRGYDNVASCMHCEKEYHLKTGKGELAVTALQVKKKDQMYVVGYNNGL